MTTFIAEGITLINEMLAPIVPAGVTGVQFVSVFLIVYTISFLLLRQIELLNKNRGAQLMLAIVIAYFTASSAFSVILITKLFPNVGVVTVILLSFIAVITMVPPGKKKVTFGPLLTIVGVGLVAYLTWTNMSGTITIEGIAMPQLTNQEWYGIMFVGIFIGLVLLIFLSGKKEGKGMDKDKIGKFAKFLFGVEE